MTRNRFALAFVPLLAVAPACTSDPVIEFPDARVSGTDGGHSDGGRFDAGASDGGGLDGGAVDASASLVDAFVPPDLDGGPAPSDAGTDAAMRDAGTSGDAGTSRDAGTSVDAGTDAHVVESDGGGSTGTDAGTRYLVSFCRIQWPPSATIGRDGSVTVYGRVYAAGLTDRTSVTDVDPALVAQVGYGPTSSDPALGAWTWIDASPNLGYGPSSPGAEEDNDEYQGSLGTTTAGTYDYAYRFSGDFGATWTYCDVGDAGSTDGTWTPGVLVVTP